MATINQAMAATVEELQIWDSFLVTIDKIKIFLIDHISEFIFVIIILLATVLIAKIVENRMVKYGSHLQKGMRMDVTKMTMLRHMSVSVIYILGFILILYTIPELKALSSTILLSVGVLSLVIGMAAQDTFGNIISGIALVFFHPFRVGDLITVGTNYGRVTDVNLRQTTMLTPDNRYIMIPNSALNKETVINWTYDDTLVRWSCKIPISHNSNIDRAREIMLEEARKNQFVLSKEILERKHVNFSEDVRARVSDVTPLGVIILLDFWVDDRDNAVPAEYAIREAIQKRFYDDPDVATPLPHYVFSRDEKTDIYSHL